MFGHTFHTLPSRILFLILDQVMRLEKEIGALHIGMIHIYIYIPEKGGTKASPQSNAHGFFVSALKYLEVKAVASC